MRPTPAAAPSMPPIVRKFVRYFISFSAGVSVGLAPYLGKWDAPGFSWLLNLLPQTVQHLAIPLSSAGMGLVAIVVQWLAEEKIPAWRARRRFLYAMTSALVLLFAFLTLRIFVVVDVSVFGGRDYVPFQVGFTRPLVSPCEAQISDAECIKRLSFDPARIESFWGDRQVRIARLLLVLTYIAYVSAFGALIGLLVLKSPKS